MKLMKWLRIGLSVSALCGALSPCKLVYTVLKKTEFPQGSTLVLSFLIAGLVGSLILFFMANVRSVANED